LKTHEELNLKATWWPSVQSSSQTTVAVTKLLAGIPQLVQQ